MPIPNTFCRAAFVLMMAASMLHAQEEAALKQEELDQLLAPIALYPDSLVSQILMAATYPIEVVQAERWARANDNLKGDELTVALEQETWDASVKSLVNFPQVLSMMSEQLDWTTKLGDAFLSHQKEVMDAIQRLRGKAKAEGNLETTEQQTVVVKEEADTQVIVIESASPEIVYVPTYNPTVVYGAWPYPAYPPYYYYPPGYVAGTAAISFGVGVACGAAWGYAWGHCNWGHGDVDIDIDRNTRINNRIDRSRYKSEIGSRNRNVQNGRGSWQHDPTHRKGAAYRDQKAAQKFGGTSSADAARARESFRGRADAGREQLARGGPDSATRRQSPGAAARDRGTPGATARDRGAGGTAGRDQRAPSTADRQRSSGRSGSSTQTRSSTDRSRQSSGSRGSAFDGVGQGQSARKNSQRGQASRSSPSRSGGRGGGMRGGGARGGGGRR